MESVFGRTNQVFPQDWIALAAPSDPAQIEPLVAAAVAFDSPIDITSQPGLWGRYLGTSSPPLMAIGGGDIARATSPNQASDFIQANLIELLSSIGRHCIEFFFLRVIRNLEDFQIVGALEALESARHDGHIRYFGLDAARNPNGARATWQLHDAFEVVSLEWDPSSHDPSGLVGMATDRRVGILTTGGEPGVGYGQSRLNAVRSVEEIRRLEVVAT
ncbi:MAG: hypothetical protein HONBIEJF_00053 [Fimbriimonadaceae bacterium]|nr:hypothetical protein [Fimbriimonadaceae bacterium]